MKEIFNNLSVKKKLLAGFGIVLLLLGGLGVVSFSTISQASDGFSTYRGWAINSNTLGRIQANLLETRLSAKNFIKSSELKYSDEFGDRFEKVHKFVDEAFENIKDKERHAQIEKVDNLSEEYGIAFEKVVSLVQQRNKVLQEELVEVGEDVLVNNLMPLVNSGNVNASVVTQHLLFVRLYTLKFLVDNNNIHINRVNKELTSAKKYATRLGRTDISAKLKRYENGVNTIVGIINKRNDIIRNKLDAIGPEIASITENIKLQYKEHQDLLGPELQASNENGNLLVVIVGFFAILLGISFAFFIANAITKPIVVVAKRVEQLQSVCITNLGEGLTQMAIGNLDAKVEKATKHLNFTQKDEVGEMARSIDKMITKAQAGIDAYGTVRNKIEDLSDEAAKLIEDAENGKLDNRGDANKFEGAYKDIISGFNSVLDAVIDPIKDGILVLEKIETGDLSTRITKDYKGDHQKIKNSINNTGHSLNQIITQISEAIQSTASASNQISSAAEELAAGSQEQSSQTSEVATAVEQMVATITQTSRSVVQTDEAARNSGDLASEGEAIIISTIQGMQNIEEVVTNSSKIILELGESSSQISEIIQVINDIADQTNLLALNAAIEAARAGEQGRGFAVVADEVRKLAERTTKATNEIEEMITKIQGDSKNAVKAINRGNEEVSKGMEQATKAGDSMSKIVKSSNQVLEISTQVATASEEQSATVEEVGRSIDGINLVSQEAAAGVQQVASAATDLSQLAENLQQLVSQFKLNNSYNKVNKSSAYSVKETGELV